MRESTPPPAIGDIFSCGKSMTQQKETGNGRHPRTREGLVIALLAVSVAGIAILFGTSRMRTAYEARHERPFVPTQQVNAVTTDR